MGKTSDAKQHLATLKQVMREKLLHPATIISFVALLVALGGTSYAVSQLPKNSVGTKQLKKNAVTSPKVKNGSLLRKDFRAGELPQEQTRAYAFITADGTLDPDRSDGVAQANVFKGTGAAGNGFYCLAGLPFEVRSAIVSSAYNSDATAAAPYIYVQIAEPGEPLDSFSGCPETGLQVVVNSRDLAGDNANSSFVIWLEG